MATKLDLADAQFVGFAAGKRSPGILDLVGGMGLTKAEWMKWKKNYSQKPLTDSEVWEIDNYFSKLSGTK